MLRTEKRSKEDANGSGEGEGKKGGQRSERCTVLEHRSTRTERLDDDEPKTERWRQVNLGKGKEGGG